MKHILILLCFTSIITAVMILVLTENTSVNFNIKLMIADILTWIGLVCGLVWFGLIAWQIYKDENSD